MNSDDLHDAPDEPTDSRTSPARLWLVCIVFLVLGALGTYVLAVVPIAHALEGRSWVRTPCRVIDCAVRRHRGKIGPTYSVDIVYEYEADGRMCRSDRWDFFPSMPGIGHEAAASVARLHPPGRMLFCYVSPLDPGQAVLDRRIRRGFPRILLPLAFLVAGGAGLYRLVRRSVNLTALKAVSPPSASGSLRPSSRWDGLLTALGVAVFLIGAAFILSRMLFDGWQEGELYIGLTVLVVGCGVVGVMIIGMVIHQALKGPDRHRDHEQDMCIRDDSCRTSE